MQEGMVSRINTPSLEQSKGSPKEQDLSSEFGTLMEMAAALHSAPNVPASQVGLSDEARVLAVQNQALAAGDAGGAEVSQTETLGNNPLSSGVEGFGSMEAGAFMSSLQSEGAESATEPGLKAGNKRKLSDDLAPKSATLSQKTIQQASSLNAGASLSGLKPWSRDWVFKGNEARDPELKTLLQDSQSTANPENLLALLSSSAEAIAKAGTSKEGQPTGQTRGLNGQKSEVRSSEAANRLKGLSSATPEELEALLMGSDLSEGLKGELSSLQSDRETTGGPQGGNSGARGTASLGGEAFLSTLQELQQGGQEGSRERTLSGQPHSSSAQASGQGMNSVRPVKGKMPQFPGTVTGEVEGKGAQKKQDPFEAAFGASAGVRSMENGLPGRIEKPQPMQVTGHVTQGAMTRERLSSESLVGLTSGIRDLSKQGGGEIRLRLKPDSLGELNLRIITRGNEVGLKIQASDPAAKKVIEESIQYLKDSLASNSLQLTRFDVQLAGSGSLSSQMQNQNGGGGQNAQDFAAQAGLTFDPNAQSGFSAAFGQQGGQNGSYSQELSSDSEMGVGSRSSSVRRPTASIPSTVMGTPGEARLAAGSGRGRIDLFA